VPGDHLGCFQLVNVSEAGLDLFIKGHLFGLELAEVLPLQVVIFFDNHALKLLIEVFVDARDRLEAQAVLLVVFRDRLRWRYVQLGELVLG